MNGVKILSSARYVPPRVLDNFELSTWVDTTDEWIIKRTGISRRHISEGENTSDMCVKVAGRLLEKTGLDAEEIDLILVTTVTPDYLTPSTSTIVQEAIGAKNACAFDVNAACTGFVYGFSVAQKYLAAEGSGVSKIMLIGAEVLSKYTDWTDRNTCVLFGDGAAGVILTSCDKRLYAEKLRSRGAKSITLSHQEVVNPFSKKQRDVGYIKVDGREVFDFAVKCVSENILELLDSKALGLDDIDYIIPHQANGRIIEGIAKKLKVDISKFYVNIEEYGNTSSASIPIALDEMFESGLIAKGNRIILSGFGGGLTWGSIIVEI